jgi:hypothetical protein
VKVVRLQDLAREIRGFGDETLEVQRVATVRGIARSIPGLVARSPVDTGFYANSWTMTANEKSAIIGNTAPHAPVIEYGARPFTPPIGPLLAWAKRVLQDPSQPPEYSSRVWALAKGVQNKIEKNGMKPRHILTNAFDMIVDNIRLELQAVKHG